MEPLSTGSVVLVPFPSSNLSLAKLRPAVGLAEAGRGDWLLSQITSNAFSDPAAAEIHPFDDFHTGTLRLKSFARPSKIITASDSLITSIVGTLELDKFGEILDAVIAIFQASRQP